MILEDSSWRNLTDSIVLSFPLHLKKVKNQWGKKVSQAESEKTARPHPTKMHLEREELLLSTLSVGGDWGNTFPTACSR